MAKTQRLTQVVVLVLWSIKKGLSLGAIDMAQPAGKGSSLTSLLDCKEMRENIKYEDNWKTRDSVLGGWYSECLQCSFWFGLIFWFNKNTLFVIKYILQKYVKN